MNQPVPKGIDWTIAQPKRESALEHFLSSRSWDLSTFKALALGVLSLAIPFFVMYRGFFGMMDPRIERSIIICLLLLYIFLRFPSGKRKWSEGFSRSFPIDLLLLLLVIATEIYTIWDQYIHTTEGITLQIFGNAVKLDHIIGIIVVSLVLEGTRRSFGWVMVIVSLFFIGYSLGANIFPGPLKGARATWTYMMEMTYGIEEGYTGWGLVCCFP